MRRQILAGRTPLKLPKSPLMRFVQAALLIRGKCYLKNLAFPTDEPDSVWADFFGSADLQSQLASYTGKVMLCPMSLGGEFADAVPVAAFLLEGSE